MENECQEYFLRNHLMLPPFRFSLHQLDVYDLLMSVLLESSVWDDVRCVQAAGWVQSQSCGVLSVFISVAQAVYPQTCSFQTMSGDQITVTHKSSLKALHTPTHTQTHTHQLPFSGVKLFIAKIYCSLTAPINIVNTVSNDC